MSPVFLAYIPNPHRNAFSLGVYSAAANNCSFIQEYGVLNNFFVRLAKNDHVDYFYNCDSYVYLHHHNMGVDVRFG
jgi:hypothetical protein